MSKGWLITGASSGFGRGMTERLLERGDRVAATVRKAEQLDKLKAVYGDALWVGVADVTDVARVEAVVAEAFDALGHIDVVVSNAGYGVFGAAEEASWDEIRHMIDTDLLGSIAVIRAAIPHLRAQGGGLIQQVSSEGGQIAYPAFSIYHAAKWGIEGFVEAVAQEIAPFNIRFSLIEPGPSGTNFGDGIRHTSVTGVYDNTPVGQIRRDLLSGKFGAESSGDKVVQRIIEAADSENPPRRLPLGSAAWQRIHDALTERLELLSSQRDVAASTDF